MTKKPAGDGCPAKDELILFGRNFRAARRALGLVQQQVADRSRVSRSDVSEIERGRINVTYGTMARLAKAVGSDVRTLLAAAPPAPKRKRKPPR